MAQSPWYYRTVISLLKPLYRVQLALRSGQKKATPAELEERFGRQYAAIGTQKPLLWVHAVSLGETNTAEPVMRALLQKGYGLWVTNTTHTGYQRTSELFASEIDHGDVYQSFVPVDETSVIERFIRHVKPYGALFIETELWANTLACLENADIPSMLINGRLSQKSFNGYQKIAKVSDSIMENLHLIIAQDSDSAKRFRQLGATSDKIRVANSLKWSSHANPIMLAKAEQLKADWQLKNRTVIVAASTHDGEESLILESFATLLNNFPAKNLLLIVVPRHPERFDTVANLIEKSHLTMVKRSDNLPILPNTQVFLADSMNELGIWYALADITLVCGSFMDIGGHNPIEAAIVGKPIIMGRYTQSCQQIVDKLKSVGALSQLENAQTPETLTNKLSIWINQPEQAKQAGQAGLQLAEKFQDVTQQQVGMIERVLANHQNHLKHRQALFDESALVDSFKKE